MSPTKRSLDDLRKRGFKAEVVERFNSFAKIRIDLFNFIDIVAIHPVYGIIGVQSTSRGNVNARIEKIRNEILHLDWIAAGGKILVHGWSKKGKRGKRKIWVRYELEITKQGFRPLRKI